MLGSFCIPAAVHRAAENTGMFMSLRHTDFTRSVHWPVLALEAHVTLIFEEPPH